MALTFRQVCMCLFLATVFWSLATLFIRFVPASFTDPVWGTMGFITALPVGFLCVWLICRLACLTSDQILAGCFVVIADSMLMDGIALRWFPGLYAPDDHVARLGAAWLLWGYGASAWIGLMSAAFRQKNTPLGSRVSG